MKQFVLLISIAALSIFTMSSCSDTTYAQELKQEQTLIKEYIKRNNIRVISSLPAKGATWGVNDYYLSSTGLYFHLSNAGTGTDTLELNNTVIPLYLQISLNEHPDTISNWSTVDKPYPDSFIFGNTSETSSAFQEAASYMKYNDSESRIIVPSKINFQTFWKPATPTSYVLKIKIKK